METNVGKAYRQDDTRSTLKADPTRTAGIAAIGGALIMLIGAALYFSSGADLWAAVDGGDMAGYLAAVGNAKTQLVANLSLWIVGVFTLGMAINAMADLGEQRPTAMQIARHCARTAVPLAILAFIAMLSLVLQIAPDTSETSVTVANVIGWIGARADDLATSLIVGFAPLFVSLAARDEWMPAWLAGWGYVSGLIGLVSLLSLYIPSLAQLGFLIVPVGLGWMIGAGVVLLRLR